MTTSIHPAPPSGADVGDDRRGADHDPTPIAPLGDHAGRTSAWRERLPLGGLLLASGLLYLVGLSRSGWANQFYAAAAQAGASGWKAFLFGSLDQSNFITVDKPPAALWIIDVSVKLFGVNSWAILVPQALEGVAAVALLYAAVKRVSGPTAGLLAGAALATTPVATLIFRYDNPDALLVLLMTGAAYATVRAVEASRPKWLVIAGVLLGFAFLTKMLQGLLVVPGFALAYLIAADTPVRRRLLHLLAAGAAMVVAMGWWIALVELWPAGSRPYIGGSTDNSILDLVFGYNGFGRLTGSDNNGATNGGTGGFSSSETGLTRLFGSEMGSQISWLLPSALVALVALGWLTWGRPRTDALRASTVVWGGWLLVTGVLFSFASGIIHPYYTVALAPAIAALVGIGTVQLWHHRRDEIARWALAALIASGVVSTVQLLGRASWHPELRWIVLGTGAAAVVAALVAHRLRAMVVAPVVALALLIAPTAYSVQTASTAHSGALPSAGPASSAGFGGGVGGGRGGVGGGQRGGFGGPNGGSTTGGTGPGAPGGSGTSSSTGTSATGGSSTGSSSTGSGSTGGFPGGGRGGFGGGAGGMGGLGGAVTVSSALQTALAANASSYEWVAATTSDNEASSLQLAAGHAVMAIGGYNGTDSAITLARFEELVKAGKIHYYVADSQGFIGSTAADTSMAYAIQQWVASTFTAQTIGGTTVYDLTPS